MKCSNKKRGKGYYTISFISDLPTTTNKEYRVGMKLFKNTARILTIIVILMTVAFILSTWGIIKITNTTESLQAEKEELTDANRELENKVKVLSESLNIKVVEDKEDEEADIAKSIPTGFPLNGTATMVEDELLHAVVLTTGAGIKVIATGNGKVASVADGEDFSRMIVVEHEEGYETIYQCNQSEEVTVGQEIDRGTILFDISSEKDVLYQIRKDGEYIMPLELMDISG